MDCEWNKPISKKESLISCKCLTQSACSFCFNFCFEVFFNLAFRLSSSDTLIRNFSVKMSSLRFLLSRYSWNFLAQTLVVKSWSMLPRGEKSEVMETRNSSRERGTLASAWKINREIHENLKSNQSYC